MPDFVHNDALDPRLQRLTVRASDTDRAGDARSGLFDTVQTDAGVVAMTRVLVLLARPELPHFLIGMAPARITERIYTVDVPVDGLDALAARPEVLFVEGGRRLLPNLTTSVAATRAEQVRQGETGLDGTGVVIGIIDYGFDFTLADFRDETGATRTAAIWDQTLTPIAGEGPPDDFPYGVEYDRTAIDAALAFERQGGNAFDRVRHVPDPESHGTHVAGIATGNGLAADGAFPAERWIGVAPRATIIYVQPRTSGQERSFTDSVHVADAIAFIYERARRLGLPCVINMSLGQNGGSHDGESVVERAIDTLGSEPGRVFVCAAGNEHTWRGHASGTIAQGATRTLKVRVGGGLPVAGGALGSGPDRTPSEIEVWYSSRDRLTLTVRTPDGDRIGPLVPGEARTVTTPAGNQVLVISDRFTPLNGDARIYIELAPGQAASVRRGEWGIELEGTEVRNGRFDAYIERDVRDQLNNFADQAFFVGDDFDGVQTLGTPATTRRGIAVANYDHVTVAPSSSSSRGPTRDGRPKPEVAAPGTNIVAACALGGRTVSHQVVPVRTRKSGTSMAAPHVAGVVAQMLQRRPRLTAEQVAAILVATAHPTGAGGSSFDPAWGHGRVDAVDAVAAIPG